MDEGKEAGVEPVEAGCETSEVFELVEAPLDPIACFVNFPVVRDDDFSRPIGGDDRLHSRLSDCLSEGLAVVGLVAMSAAPSTPSIIAGAATTSWTCPPVSINRSGRPKASASIWILVVLGNAATPDFWPPFSGRRLLVRPNHGRIEHEVLVFAIADQSLRHPLPHPGFCPPRKPGVDTFPFLVSLGKIAPAGTRPQNPKDAVHELPLVALRPARIANLPWQKVLHALPLPI
jgi:hypothetical protein